LSVLLLQDSLMHNFFYVAGKTEAEIAYVDMLSDVVRTRHNRVLCCAETNVASWCLSCEVWSR